MHFLGTGEQTRFAWNSYTAVYSSLFTLYTCSAPVCTVQLINNRLASVEVSLTILKTETT